MPTSGATLEQKNGVLELTKLESETESETATENEADRKIEREN